MLLTTQLVNASILWSICGILYSYIIPNINEIRHSPVKFTSEEISAIGQLRLRTKDILEDEYERSNVFLIKWLRANDLNVDTATRMLKAAKAWRKENHIESILNETILLRSTHDPCLNVGYDIEGSPVSYLRTGGVNTRRMMLSGKGKKIAIRFTIQCLEDTIAKIRRAYRNSRNVSQGLCVIDGTGYNLVQQGCIECIRFYLIILDIVSKYYPGVTKEFILINVPAVAKAAIDMGIQFAPKDATIKVFGYNRNEWIPFLRKIIPPDQLPVQYGGNLRV